MTSGAAGTVQDMKIISIVSIVFVLVSCSSTGGRQNESVRLNQFLDDQFETNLALSPQFLTIFGRKDRYHELNDQTEAFSLKVFELRKKQLADLQNFDRAKLDAQAQLTYDLVKKDLQEEIEDHQWRDYRYMVTQHGGIHTGLPTFMITKHRVDTEKDLRDYISRLGEFKRVFTETIDRMNRSKAKGIVPPKFVFSDIYKASKNVVTGAPFGAGADSPLFADFKNKLAKLKLPEEKNRELTALAHRALLESVKPAYENLTAALQELEKVATTDDGVWKFPRGAEFYNLRLKRTTTTDLTADQIHELGLVNVARLRRDMIEVKNKLGFTGSLPQFFDKMRKDPAQYFPNTDAGRKAYLAMAANYGESINKRVPEFFRLVPKTPFEIRAVEKFREQSSGKAFYDRPSDDGSRPGVYYVNLREMKDVPKFEAEALLYHEGVPGHHFQIALTIEMKNLPKARRYNHYTAFSEGWGLYTERLGKEMGGYTDLYSELGRLSMEMLRASRLVVDTGIHHKKWTRKQALDFFNQNLPVSEGAQSEQIERYIVMPGQATAYMVGMLKIYELRENAKAKLGDKFDIRDFHDVVLSNGPVPLDVLESFVNDYVKTKTAI